MMPVSILSGKKEADVTEISYIRSIWCGRRDSNPHTTEVTEPKSFGLFFRPQLSTALRSRKPLKPQGFVHFRARLRRENKMQNFLVGENQGENSQRTGENFLGPITGRTNYDKPHDPLLMAILQEVVKHEVESILRGNLFSIP